MARLLTAATAAKLLAPAWLCGVALACSSMFFQAPDGIRLTARTMDWQHDMGSTLWKMPRGLTHGPDSYTPRRIKGALEWTSKYGSIINNGYWNFIKLPLLVNMGTTTDGLNEKGLWVGLLFLSESRYNSKDPSVDSRPEIGLSAIAQYFLDNYATVADALEGFTSGGEVDQKGNKQSIYKVTAATIPTLSGPEAATIHVIMSDSTGDMAVLEWLGTDQGLERNGTLVVHHSRDYVTATNSPTYDKQLALVEYWQSVNEGRRTPFLPGSLSAPDRFARNDYYVREAMEQAQADPQRCLTQALSLIRGVSVPVGMADASVQTVWRVVVDQTNTGSHSGSLRYLYEDVEVPNVFWVDLDRMNFTEGSGVELLDLATLKGSFCEESRKANAPQPQLFPSGEASAMFKPHDMFKFSNMGGTRDLDLPVVSRASDIPDKDLGGCGGIQQRRMGLRDAMGMT